MKRIIWMFALLVCLLNKSFAENNELDASVYIKNDGSIPYILVDGNITKNTYLDIERVIARIPSGYPKVIDLNSSGGDVASAIKIGYLLRNHSFAAFVSNRSKCASACVFI